MVEKQKKFSIVEWKNTEYIFNMFKFIGLSLSLQFYKRIDYTDDKKVVRKISGESVNVFIYTFVQRDSN